MDGTVGSSILKLKLERQAPRAVTRGWLRSLTQQGRTVFTRGRTHVHRFTGPAAAQAAAGDRHSRVAAVQMATTTMTTRHGSCTSLK